ncbi:glycosyltransferase family 4 protein [Vagococcus sp. BWB3-3]|uniref:Glycosyltransferase family 4 protein n=1 Tax=Vagococcus allomyrinae TaxID=2794353 RepID=A0A940P8N8_9ENTE|nr:glycosyltransferase family 4 protein [Vagococcus allomyrinae]MBP1040479.1 glycosyltransferase family 4 protein [Vagococcus allomyrinae]
MRIGIFSDTYFPQVSGVSTSIKTLKESLEGMGHQVYIFTTTDPKAEAAEENIVRLPSIAFMSFKDRRIAISGNYKALRIARQLKLDVIHTQTEFSLGFIGKHVAKQMGIPHIHTYHTMYEDYLHYIAGGKLLRPRHVAALSRYFCNQADGVVAPSKRVEDQLRGYEVYSKIGIIPTGVDLSKFKPVVDGHNIRHELNLRADQPIILSLSRLSEEKNIMAVIQAMPEVLQSRPDARLVIVGGGPQRDELEKAVSELAITEAVVFTGEKKSHEVPNYYTQADVFVSASESESQGLTYIEALACKTAIVAKENDYTKTLVGPNGELGTLVVKDGELAQALLKELNSIESQSIEAIRGQVLEEISGETFARNIVSFYHDCDQTVHPVYYDQRMKVF